MLNSGMIIILTSPSGAGKTTLSRLLVQQENIIQSISYTTREPRKDEVHGKDYFFATKEEFIERCEHQEMLEYAKVFDNYYGTPKQQVIDNLKNKKDVLFTIDWQGGVNIINSELKEHVVSIFILPPSLAELERRLHKRGTDSAEDIKKRLNAARLEMLHHRAYEYTIINDNIERSLEHIMQIIHCERKKTKRQLELSQLIIDM